MPAVAVSTPTLTAAADYAVYLLRFPLVFLAAIVFSVSFGVYMIDSMGAWRSGEKEEEGVLHPYRQRYTPSQLEAGGRADKYRRSHVENGRMRHETA
jgi:hypothetical protein